MTFWNLLTGLGFSFAVAALVNALISRDAQLALFNSEPGNLGRDCTLFIDNTIFRFCGRTLLSWRPLVISLSMFSTALIVLVLAGLWRSPDRTNFLHFFIEPFQPLSVSTTLVAFFCLTVIVIDDYLSFVQTFLLMRYAARTFLGMLASPWRSH